MGLLDAPPTSRAAVRTIAGTTFAAPNIGDVFPEVMADPPTLTLSAQQASSPIASALNGSNNGLNFNGNRFTHRNGVFGTLVANSNSYWQNQCNAGDPGVSARSMEFEFYGNEFAVKFRNILTTGISQLWVWVDGKPATAAPVTYSAAIVANSPYWLTVTFAAPRNSRIRIWSFGTDLADVSYAAGNYATPVVTREPKLFVLGDSWIGGAANVQETELHGWLLPVMLGMEGIRAGQGSTGLTTAGTGAPKEPYTASARIAKIILAQPEYLYVHISQNDDGNGTGGSSTMQTAAASVLSQVLAGSPATRAILMGPPRINADVPTGRTNNNNGALAAATAATNCIGYIDNINNAIYGRAGSVLHAATGTPWLTGTGRVGAQALDGTNADNYVHTDSAHLTSPGHRYWALRAALACKIILEAA